MAVTGAELGDAFLAVEASPSLAGFIKQTAALVLDPWKTTADTNVTLWQSWQSSASNGEPEIGELGSGSDYTAFLQFAGIASVNLAFDATFENHSTYGVYHSIYDSYSYSGSWADPEDQGKFAMTQYWGLLTQSLADAALLPFNFTDYATALQFHLGQAQSYANSSNLGALDFSQLSLAIGSFSSNAANLSSALLAFNATQNATVTQLLNGILAGVEQKFLAYGDTYAARAAQHAQHRSAEWPSLTE